MDWIAQEHELITSAGVSCDRHKAIVRSDNNKYVGIVGKDYGVVQNVEFFSMFDIVAREKGATFANVKAFDGGTRVVAKMKLPILKNHYVRKVGDVVGRELLLINSFDGSTGFVGECRVNVLSCTNGLTTNRRESSFVLRHTKNVKERYAEALKVFARAERYFDEVLRRSRALAKKIFDKEKMKKFTAEMFPADAKTNKVSTRAQNQRDIVFRLFFEGMGNLGKSAFDAYNALTEYLDHKRFTDSDKADKANIFGTGRKMRDHAFAYLERV